MAYCNKYVGQGWDQEEACFCILLAGHAGDCKCRHTAHEKEN